jgi:hypothetical protein
MPFIEDIDTCDFTVYQNEFELSKKDILSLMKENALSETDNPLLIIEVSSLTKGT